MGRLLKELKVRCGRPKPTASCPWSKAPQNRRMALIHALVESLPAEEACVWADEADFDLNPRIGFDYMLPGTQRTVPTPGMNVKRYLAGAMDATSDRVMCTVHNCTLPVHPVPRRCSDASCALCSRFRYLEHSRQV
jgi:hypothetical protein